MSQADPPSLSDSASTVGPPSYPVLNTSTSSLQVLGDGDLTESFTIEAGSFSKTAKAKLEAAGCNVVQLPGKVKWTKKAYFKKLRYEASLKEKAKAKDA